MLSSRGAPFVIPRSPFFMLSSRGAQRRGICSPPLTLMFHPRALVIPTPHACCHPDPFSLVIPRSAATRDLQSPIPNIRYRKAATPCHPDPFSLVIPRSAATRDLQSTLKSSPPLLPACGRTSPVPPAASSELAG